jgi:hypothetical protein
MLRSLIRGDDGADIVILKRIFDAYPPCRDRFGAKHDVTSSFFLQDLLAAERNHIVADTEKDRIAFFVAIDAIEAIDIILLQSRVAEIAEESEKEISDGEFRIDLNSVEPVDSQIGELLRIITICHIADNHGFVRMEIFLPLDFFVLAWFVKLFEFIILQVGKSQGVEIVKSSDGPSIG